MARGSFDGRIRDLERSLPDHLVGEGIRDQAYAQYQHETLDLEHPHGGQAKYQETALYEHAGHYVQQVADELLEGDVVKGMERAMLDFDADSGELTPKDHEVLTNSCHVRVLADGQVERDIPPKAPRLSLAELRDLNRKSQGRWATGGRLADVDRTVNTRGNPG